MGDKIEDLLVDFTFVNACKKGELTHMRRIQNSQTLVQVSQLHVLVLRTCSHCKDDKQRVYIGHIKIPVSV